MWESSCSEHRSWRAARYPVDQLSPDPHWVGLQLPHLANKRNQAHEHRATLPFTNVDWQVSGEAMRAMQQGPYDYSTRDYSAITWQLLQLSTQSQPRISQVHRVSFRSPQPACPPTARTTSNPRDDAKTRLDPGLTLATLCDLGFPGIKIALGPF
jgi:hypothetical protein